MSARLEAVYRVRCEATAIAERARAIAVEQSVEMPVEAISDPWVQGEIVGRVENITALGSELHEVRISLNVETVSEDPGQLLNMLFGNSSLHEDLILHDATLPDALLSRFGGPGHGVEGLRKRVGGEGRALTCSALKPQGLPVADIADLAYRLALGRLDYIKDDHGLADQSFSPFTDRVAACAEAVRRASAKTGHDTRYVPSLSGSLDALRQQAEAARTAGIDAVMIAPMIAGLSNILQLKNDYPEMAFFAHPTMAGAARIAPAFLLGRLFRAVGADAVIFPNHGGRFGYSPDSCRHIGDEARARWGSTRAGSIPIKPAIPVPAGGMAVERVTEMLEFYGPDVMLLIGGGLLSAGVKLTDAASRFTAAVMEHSYEQ